MANLVTRSTSNLSTEASWSPQQVAILKSQIAPKATDAELEYFGAVCKRLNLDPFSRQIYAIHRWDKSVGADKMTIQVGIDGLRALASRTGKYAGSDAPRFDEGLSLYQVRIAGRQRPTTAAVTVWKVVGGQRCPFVGEVSWDEFSQNSGLWQRSPFNQLAKCAEAQALRKAFPSELGELEVMDDSLASSDRPPSAQDEIYRLYDALEMDRQHFSQELRSDLRLAGRSLDRGPVSADVPLLVGVRLGTIAARALPEKFGEDFDQSFVKAKDESGRWLKSDASLIEAFKSRDFGTIGRRFLEQLETWADQVLQEQPIEVEVNPVAKGSAVTAETADPDF